MSWLAFSAGLGGILFGGDILVKGSVLLARDFGLSEEMIGITLIAFGTSLPELAAAGIAAYRGHTGLALGIVIGSNVFNITGIIGLAAVTAPLTVSDQIRTFDIWVMLSVTLLLFLFLTGTWKLTRSVGIGFLVAYAFYIVIQSYGVNRFLTLLSSIG